jgi:hypothetical protein
LSKCLSGRFWAEFSVSDEVERGIPDVSEVVRSVLRSDPAGIFGEGSIFDAEETVFDLPVVSCQLQQGGFIHHSDRDRCDGVDDLPRAERPGFTQALDPDNARGVFPDSVEPRRDGAHQDTPCLDAAMAAINMLRPPQIRRIKSLCALARAAGEP